MLMIWNIDSQPLSQGGWPINLTQGGGGMSPQAKHLSPPVVHIGAVWVFLSCVSLEGNVFINECSEFLADGLIYSTDEDSY
jgi:hypothetical protein